MSSFSSGKILEMDRILTIHFHNLDEKINLQIGEYSKTLIIVPAYPSLNIIPKHVPATSVLLVAVVETSVSLLYVMRPSDRLPPQVIHLATLKKGETRWILRQKVPSLLEANMLGLSLKLGISRPNARGPKRLARVFAKTVSAVYWLQLMNHFKFKVSPIHIKRALTEEDLFNGDLKHYISAVDENSVDFIGDLVLISSERSENLDFVLVGLDYKFHFFVRRPDYTYSWTGFTRPLTFSVWLAFLGMVCLTSSILYFIQSRKTRSSTKTDLLSTMFTVIGFGCSQAHLGKIQKVSIQIACVSALLFFYNINQFYVSNLYSILSTREFKYPFNTMEEFVERKSHRLAIHQDTPVYKVFEEAEAGILQKVYRNFFLDDPDHLVNVTSMKRVIERLCSGTTAVFALPLQAATFRKRCPMIATPTGYFMNLMGFAANKKFPFVRHFRAFFTRAAEAGILDYLRRRLNGPIAQVMRKPELSLEPLPIPFEQVFAAFAMYFCFCVASLFLLFIERHVDL